MSSPAKKVKPFEFETRLYINGEFVPSAKGKKFPTVNPFDESVITEVYEADAEDVDKAVKAARKAFDSKSAWRTMPATKRRDLMLKLAELIERDREELAHLEALDNGKPLAASGRSYGSTADIHLVIQCLRYYAGWADKICGTTIPVDANNLVYTIREPVGVCAQIIPWNFPALMCAWKLGPALAAGCTIVLKTSEKTPLSGLKIARLIHEAGFPPGVVNILSGFGPTCGMPMVQHPEVDKVAFTGSTPVGKLIEKACADTCKRVTLELGGKSALIVFDDCDMKQALEVAHVGLFLNHGQCCCAASRLYVQDTIYDKFVAEAVKMAKARKVGDPFSEDTEQGPLVDELQHKRVLNYLAIAKKEGATIAAGGDRPAHIKKGYFVEPTVLTDVTDEMTCSREEIFGPVMSVMKFHSVDEVVERANKSNYGLAAGICSRDVGKCLRVASELKAGTVWVNTYNSFDAAQPFGGFKESGKGRELGSAALDNYTELKTVVIPRDR